MALLLMAFNKIGVFFYLFSIYLLLASHIGGCVLMGKFIGNLLGVYVGLAFKTNALVRVVQLFAA